MGCVAVLEDRLHELVVVMLPALETQSWSILFEDFTAVSALLLLCGKYALLGWCVPILHPLLEDTAHHLGASISRDGLWNIPGGAEVSHDSNQMLAVELALGGGHYGVLPREPVGDHQEVVAV